MKISIIGGGIGGLTAAYNLSRNEKIKLSLYETENELGGRLKTENVDNSYVDVGSQLISSADLETMNIIKQLNLSPSLRSFSKTYISIYHDGKLIPGSLFSTGIYNILSPNEKKTLNTIKLELKNFEKNYDDIIRGPSKYTDLTLHELLENEIGETPKILDTILRAICFSDSKTLSALYGFTTLYIYLQDCYFLSHGMNDIISSLAYNVKDNIIINLNSKISKIYVEDQKIKGFNYAKNDSSKEILVDGLISAIPASELSKLLPRLKLTEYLSKIKYNPCILILLKTKKRLWKKTWGVIFHKDVSPISFMFDHSLKHDSFSHLKGIIGVLIPANTDLIKKDNNYIKNFAISQINELFKFNERDVIDCKVYKWNNGIEVCSPNFHKLLSKIQENLIEGLYLCGGYIGLPSQDSAIESARNVANILNGENK